MTRFLPLNRFPRMTFFLFLIFNLSACIPTALTGGSAMDVQYIHDRREGEVIMHDREIEEVLTQELRTNQAVLDRAHINILVFNEKVLLVGQVPDEAMKRELEQLTKKIPHVKKVYNELKIGPVTGLAQRATDAYLTTRIKSSIITNNTLGSMLIDVMTENGIVYLMGLVTRAEADEAVEKARSFKGVNEVVRFFEYVD